MVRGIGWCRVVSGGVEHSTYRLDFNLMVGRPNLTHTAKLNFLKITLLTPVVLRLVSV